MYSCIIIDDEPIARRIIKNHLALFHDFKVEAECANALEAVQVLSKKKTDLLFCDIQMPQISGIDLIKSLTNPPKIIFTTAYRDHAADAFDLDVVDYLLKPISLQRFTKAINKFLESVAVTAPGGQDSEVSAQDSFIFLKADKKHHKINLEEILWIESLGDYVLVYTDTGKVTVKDRIGAVAEMLPKNKFIRIHRGFIASIKKINSIGPGFVEVRNKKLPIGRLYKTEVGKLLNRHNLGK